MSLDSFIKYADFIHMLPNIENMDIQDPSVDLKEMLRVIYEWEYKYSRVLAFNIPEQRKDNMLSKIEEKINPFISTVAEVLKSTYSTWLSFHAITDPDTWAEMWTNELAEEGEDFQLGSMWTTYNQYGYSDENQKKYDLIAALANDENVKKALDQFIMNEMDSISNDIDDIGEDEANERTEELERMLDSVEDMAEYFFNFYESAADLVEYLSNSGVSIHEICFSMYRNVIFSKWYMHWESEGIDEIVDNNTTILNELNNINNQSFKQKLATLSIALNGVHVTGDMLSHIAENYPEFTDELTTNDLNDFSNTDEETIALWDEELRQGL